MPSIFYALILLACPVGMGLMMWFMMRGMSGSNSTGTMGNTMAPEGTRYGASTTVPSQWSTVVSRAAQPALGMPQLPEGLTREQHLALLQQRLSALQAEQQALAAQLAQAKQTATPTNVQPDRADR